MTNDEEEEEANLIFGTYCTCKSGARTLETYSRVAAVLCFLGYARNQEQKFDNQKLFIVLFFNISLILLKHRYC